MGKGSGYEFTDLLGFEGCRLEGLKVWKSGGRVGY